MEKLVNNFKLIYHAFKDKKVLITGHTGFKGAWLSLWLTKLGSRVIGYSLEPPSTPNMYTLAQIQENIYLDIRDNIKNYSRLSDVILQEKPDFIFHLAAQTIVSESYKDPYETISTNVDGTLNLLNILKDYNQNCVCIIVTSDKCYKNKEQFFGYREVDELGGHDPYSYSKATVEMLVNTYRKSFFDNSNNIKVATVRSGNVIGGGDWGKDRIIPDAIRAFENKEILKIRSPRSVRPWMYVLDTLYGYILLASRIWFNPGNKIYQDAFNFAPNSPFLSVLDLVKKLDHINSVTMPYRGILVDIEIVPNNICETNMLYLSNEKSVRLLNWTPKSIDMMKWIGSWYLEYLEKKDMRARSLDEIDSYEPYIHDKNSLFNI